MECSKSLNNCSNEMELSLTDLVLKPRSKKIARPPNAFMIFAREHRKSFASQNPNLNNKIISKMLGDAWKKVDSQTKEMYFEKSKQLELLHKQKYPNYFYSPRIARLQKMKRSIRRARLRRDQASEDEAEEHTVKPKKRKGTVEPEPIVKEENWKSDFYQKPPSPEYIPNNPDYFKNSSDIKDPLTASFHRLSQTQSSSRSSCTSLCFGSDDRCSDFHPRAPSICDCSNCNKYWPNRNHPPHLEPYWSSCQRDCTCFRSLEADGFPAFPPPAYPCCHTPLVRPQYSQPSFFRAPNYMRDCNTMDNSMYGHVPCTKPYTWRTSLEEDDCLYRNGNHYRRSDCKCCKNYVPRHFLNHDYPTYPCGNEWNDNTKLQCQDFSVPVSTETDTISDVYPGCEEIVQNNDFKVLDPVNNLQNESTLNDNGIAFKDEKEDLFFIN